MFRQRTKLAHRVAAQPTGAAAFPGQNANNSNSQYPNAPTPPNFYNPNAGAPPAPSPGPALQQSWQQSPQQPQQHQQWYPQQQEQQHQQQMKYPPQPQVQNNNQDWSWNNWDQQQAQWEPVEQTQNQQWNQQQPPQQQQQQQQQQPLYPAYDSQNNYYDQNYQQAPEQNQAYQHGYQAEQQNYPRQQQQSDSWAWETWNQGGQDNSWNWEDKESAVARTKEEPTVEQVEQQMADINLNEPAEVVEKTPPPPPSTQQNYQQVPSASSPQRQQVQRSISPLLQHPPVPEPDPPAPETFEPQAPQTSVENQEFAERIQDQFSAHFDMMPENEEIPQAFEPPPPAVSPLPPPPPVSSRVTVGQDDPSPWPSVIPPPENVEQQRPTPSQSTSPPLPPPPAAENVDPVSASDRNQFLETGQLSAELPAQRTVPGESRQSPVPGGPRVVPGTTEPDDEPNGRRSETIGSECDEPTTVRTTGEGVGNPTLPPAPGPPPSVPRTSAEGVNDAPQRPAALKLPKRPPPAERTNAEGTNSEVSNRPMPPVAPARAVSLGEQGSAFKEVSRRRAEGEATPERDPAPESELEEGEISDMEIISGGEFENEADEEVATAQEKRRESSQPTPESPPISPVVDKKERRRRERERKESDEKRLDKKQDKSKGKPPRPGKEEPKRRQDRDREPPARGRRRKEYDDDHEEDSDSNHSEKGRRYRGDRTPDRKHSSYRSGRQRDSYYRDRDLGRDRDRDLGRDRDRDLGRDRDRNLVRDRDDYRHHKDYRYEDDRYSNRERSRPPSRAGSEARRDPYESDHYDRNRARSSRDKAYHDYRHHQRRDPRDPYYGRGGYDYYGRPYDTHPHYPRGPSSLQLHFPEYTPQTAAFYEEMRRTNPAAYAEWYRRYISMGSSSQPGPSSTVDGFNDDNSRDSVHSGRSSINEELRYLRARSPAHSLRDVPLSPMYLRQGPPSLPPTFHPYHPQQTLLLNTPSQIGASASVHAIEATPIQRLTPAKFSSAHAEASISSQGRLVHVLPHYPRDGQVATVLLHDLQALMLHEPIVSELRAFPGPLVSGSTHKNSVIQFCTQKMKNALADPEMVDRDSYILLWKLLILLLKLNGTVDGTDIAELLLEDSQLAESPRGSSVSGSSDSEDDARRPGAKNRLSEEQVTAQFRKHLLFGNTKEALDCAMKHGLWGHALFLASKMDNRTYASVLTRFANGLPMNDPLQTLYQLMSGRQPAAVTSVSDEKWGDWKPHLAMILSNPTRPELDQRAISTLGDTLAARGCLFASQFCYLVAKLEFGAYGQQLPAKLCLLASSASLPLEQFATVEAIQCTEVYEYARRLGNTNFHVSSLQPFKFMYACQLVDFGFTSEALLYCEELAKTLVTHNITGVLAAQVVELADKLKQIDPLFSPNQQLDGEDSFYSSDPDWLASLRQLASQSPVPVDAYYYSEQQQLNDQQQQQAQDDYANQQYWNQQQQWQEQQQAQQNENINLAESTHTDSMAQQQYQYSLWQQQQQQQPPPQWSVQEESQVQSSEPQVPPPSQQQQLLQPSPVHQPTPLTSVPQTPEPNQSMTLQPGYSNYWDQSNQQPEQPECLGRSTPERDSPSISLGPSRPRQKTLSESSSGSNKASAPSKQQQQQQQRQNQQALNPGQDNSGWFSGLLNKITLRPKNQMNLPDDSNPSIVWDEKQKKWINKDEDGADGASGPLPPPPRMMQPIASSTPVSSPAAPSNNASLAGTMPPASSGGYKMGRNMRKNYVNVLQQNGAAIPSPSAAPADLFPSMGTNTAAPPVRFVPAPVDGAPASSDYMTPASTPMVSPSSDSDNSGQQQAGFALYNPSQFAAPQYQ